MSQISVAARFACQGARPMPHSHLSCRPFRAIRHRAPRRSRRSYAPIARAIEYTRVPYTLSSNDDLSKKKVVAGLLSLSENPGIANYLIKANTLFYEFEEIGLNKKLGSIDTPDRRRL